MAKNDNTPPPGGSKSDVDVEAKRIVAETLIVVEAVLAGIETLERQPEARPLKDQIEILKDVTRRAIDTVDGFQSTLNRSS